MATVQAVGQAAELQAQAGAGRLFFIDNLRWAMIVQVVVLHLAVTYGPVGGWYYREQPPLGPLPFIVFTLFCSASQAFFMGFLFFIAGYFVPGACDRKGARRFILDRLVRLGLPALIYMLLIHPVTVMLLRRAIYGDPLRVIREYPQYLVSLKFLGSSGPLWFAVALLIFSIAYAAARALTPPTLAARAQKTTAPAPLTHGAVAALILGVAAATFLVRLVQPIGSSIMNMQLCFFPQYVALFALGALAFRRDLLTRLPTAFGMAWLKLALALGLPFWFAMMLPSKGDITPILGGWRWEAAAYAFWESFFCAGVCLGLLVIFRDRFNAQGRLAGFLSRNAFGVYVFHAPILVGMTLLARGLPLHPLLKWLAASALLVPLCFAFSAAIRKIPLCARIFS